MNKTTPLATLLCVVVSVAPVNADFDFPNFTSTAGINLVGNSLATSSTILLTLSQPSISGGAWHGTPQVVGDDFMCDFELSIAPSGGADGMAFVIQNTQPGPLGAAGCELGYHDIANSVAIEFDTFSNSSCFIGGINDPAGVHISVHTLGTSGNSVSEAASIGATTSIPIITDGATHAVRVQTIGSDMHIYVDNFVTPVLSVTIDLDTTLNLDNGRAWVGFTAATGGLSQNHRVHSWSFDESGTSSGNQSPATPTITEPSASGMTLSPADVHMETSAFSDGDVGDMHRCTDWEIWSQGPRELVWRSPCTTGPASIHIHLGDGQFQGSLAGQTTLNPNASYRLRARHSDDSGDALSEWGGWVERSFNTGSNTQVYPLDLEDITTVPAPAWTFAVGGNPAILPPGGSPPAMHVESAFSQTLLTFEGLDGTSNSVSNPVGLGAHVDVRLHIDGGSTGFSLDETDLRFVDEHCQLHTIYVPALNVPASGSAYYWVASTGATWVGSAGQTSPVFTTLARAPEPPWVTFEAGYVAEVFAEGLQLPVHIAFVPDPGTGASDPLLYVTELYGDIKVVTRDGSVGTYASNLLDFSPTGAFPGSGEQGLTGIAVDPISGDVFASLLHDSVSSPGTHYPKVMRFSSVDGGHTASTQTTIIDFTGESQGQSHQISTLTIHPDGSLIVHMGDGFSSWTALNLSSYRGKILRMDLNGNALPDNPLYDAGNGIGPADYIWAYGVRNPFGGAWRASDGNQYAVENGPGTDRLTKIVSGRNFGWNGNESSMPTHALYRWIPAHGPASIAFVQPETHSGSGFPQSKMGHAFVSESGPTYASGPQSRGKRISEFVLDTDGTVLSGPTPFLEYVGSGRATSVGLAAGPDGLYMTDLYRDAGNNATATGARILRVRYLGGEDCNGNGEPDSCDIASGFSQDVNTNGVPDECDCAGVVYCDSEANSTGNVAMLSTNGNCDVSANSFELTAAPVPNQIGIFFYGNNQAGGGAGIPFYNGRLCISGSLRRLSPVTASGQSASFTMDLTSPPTATGQITPGSTWNFQFWFRDPAAGGQFVNFSNARAVTFD
ncbi:MAG: glucose/arabinose dehydrogenase [Planctomycetota bacterium]|jgi:glucose/arabinose dehydrogenase